MTSNQSITPSSPFLFIDKGDLYQVEAIDFQIPDKIVESDCFFAEVADYVCLDMKGRPSVFHLSTSDSRIIPIAPYDRCLPEGLIFSMCLQRMLKNPTSDCLDVIEQCHHLGIECVKFKNMHVADLDRVIGRFMEVIRTNMTDKVRKESKTYLRAHACSFAECKNIVKAEVDRRVKAVIELLEQCIWFRLYDATEDSITIQYCLRSDSPTIIVNIKTFSWS